MSLEIIPSALFTAGSGGIIGFLIGFAIKRVLKILAVVAGLFFGVLFYLQSQSIVTISWDKIYTVSEPTLSIISSFISNTGQISLVTESLGLPLTGGLSAGLVIGLSR